MKTDVIPSNAQSNVGKNNYGPPGSHSYLISRPENEIRLCISTATKNMFLLVKDIFFASENFEQYAIDCIADTLIFSS